jgi:hypothetical protein
MDVLSVAFSLNYSWYTGTTRKRRSFNAIIVGASSTWIFIAVIFVNHVFDGAFYLKAFVRSLLASSYN